MALKDEKFFNCLHSYTCTQIEYCYIESSYIQLSQFLEIIFDPDLCNSNPPLDDACSVGGAGLRARR